jgi:hypothetical protein
MADLKTNMETLAVAVEQFVDNFKRVVHEINAVEYEIATNEARIKELRIEVAKTEKAKAKATLTPK